MANILLIYPRPNEIKKCRFGYSLNLLYLGTILQKEGHNIVCYLDYFIEEYDEDRLFSLLTNTDIVLIEFDSFSLRRSINLIHGYYLVKCIKSTFPNIKIIAFGYDLILVPRQLKYADYTCTSELETCIIKIVNFLLKGNKINFKNIYFNNLDKLPFPNRNLLSEYIEHGGCLIRLPYLARSALIQTSRGCLNNCIFCQRKGWFCSYRVHSIEYTVEEFKHLYYNGYKNIWIIDDNFTYNLKRAKSLLKKLIKTGFTSGMKISLSSWVNIDKEFIDLAKEANVSIISFGIESGDKKISEFYRKNINLTQLKKVIQSCEENGIFTVGNFILGAPMETEETIKKTLDLMLELPLDAVNIKILDYMVGSDLFNLLPSNLKKRALLTRHIFGIKEYGLSNFYLEELKAKISEMGNTFYSVKRKKIKAKIKKYGMPILYVQQK